MRYFIVSIFLISTLQVQGQLLQTDLYLFKVFNNGEKITLRSPSFLSGFNPDGYNNQPAFSSPYELYLTTNMYNESFTDILRLDLLSNTYYRVTATDSISEYSPTPKGYSNHFTTVRVEKDGTTQTLHAYPLDHSHEGSRLLPTLSTIGYHQWVSDTEVALFLLPEPFTLVLADVELGTSIQVQENIGRCLKLDKNGNLIYVHKVRPDLWYIKSYDPETREHEVVIKTLPESEDYELLPDGTYLMGRGSALYYYNPEVHDTWKEAADLYEYGIQNITRLAVSRNQLVLVNTKS